MCRALTLLCVAADSNALTALKRAAVAAEWELAPGATSEAEALEQLELERPHVLVVFGPFEPLIAAARERAPALRVISDRKVAGVDVVASSLEDVRGAVLGQPRPRGPVRS